MTENKIELPPEWSEQPEESQRGTAVAEYRHTTVEGTAFVVSVFQRSSDAGGYKLQLSTSAPISNGVHHDYPVEEYETRVDAFEGAESFIEHISVRLLDGSISHDDPEIEEIRGMIQDFSGGQLFSSIRQLVRRLYR